jgi:hypothetical protein
MIAMLTPADPRQGRSTGAREWTMNSGAPARDAFLVRFAAMLDSP